MKRQECEEKIVEKLRDINKILFKYSGDKHMILSLCVDPGDGYVSFFNRYWAEDAEFPLDKTITKKTEIQEEVTP